MTPDTILAHTRRYALFIADKVKDVHGSAVQAEAGFQWCLDEKIGRDYCTHLAQGVRSYASHVRGNVIGGSLFTTLSVTPYMEGVHAQLQSIAPETQPATPKSTFEVSSLGSLTLHLQTATNPDQFADTLLPLNALARVRSRAMRQVAIILADVSKLEILAVSTTGAECSNLS